jgi:hypothetical protein
MNLNYLKLGLLIFSSLLSCKTKSVRDTYAGDIQNGIVFHEEGRFAGWPANHGIWIWDNEILVGFVEAAHMDSKGFHTYDRSTATNKYARSNDGGRSWTIEDAYEHGQTARGFDNNISGQKIKIPVPISTPIEDFTHPGFIFTFLRQHNDHGPSHFYYSKDRGKIWEGPFVFPDLNTNGVATRTDYIVDGPKELTAFITVAKSNKREGRVTMVRTTDGGLNWELVSWIGPEPEGFDIMPSSVRLSPTELLTVIRTRTGNGQDLMTSWISGDNGKSWEKLKDPVADTGKGGSPPALLKLNDGRLALAYIYRSQYGSRVNIRFSADNGASWSDEIILRGCDGATFDVGYPRMVQRPDGKLVIIYYWNNANQEGAKPFRYIASTIVDPNLWN